MDVMIDDRFFIRRVSEIRLLTSVLGSFTVSVRSLLSDLGVPKVGGEVVASLPELKSDDFVHYATVSSTSGRLTMRSERDW